MTDIFSTSSRALRDVSAIYPLVSVRKVRESFESVRGGAGACERLESCVILSAAPLCEVPMWTTKNRPRYDRDKLRYPSDLTDEE
jgi:hypothetical protein